MNALAQALAADIAAGGPLTVAEFMARALYDPQHGYYSTRDPIGQHGDFITAPEISPLFGEMIGLWCVQSWLDMGAPDPFLLVEVGPGRGTLMADVLRAAKIRPGFAAAARVWLVEVNPVLREAQAHTLGQHGAVEWAHSLDEVPTGPMLLIGNEFLDCLPIRQFVRVSDGWREKLLGLDAQGNLTFGLSPVLPDPPMGPDLGNADEGEVQEVAPALAPLIAGIASRLSAASGRTLFIDYSADGYGDTLQAIRKHQKTAVLDCPGEADLTAHVDFSAVARLGREGGLRVEGPQGQGEFLMALGLGVRAEQVIRRQPERANATSSEVARLTDPAQMGTLFQAIALSSNTLPPAPGFPP